MVAMMLLIGGGVVYPFQFDRDTALRDISGRSTRCCGDFGGILIGLRTRFCY